MLPLYLFKMCIRDSLKTEIMIEDLYDKVNAILARQTALEKQLTDWNTTSSAARPPVSVAILFSISVLSLIHI